MSTSAGRLLPSRRFVVCLVVLGVSADARLHAQGLDCLTNADTAAVHIQDVTRIVTTTDSATLVNQGIPYQPPAGVSLVTDEQTCQAVLSAYNALYPPADSAYHLSRSYVLRVGTDVLVLTAHTAGAQDVTYVFFDAQYRWLIAMASLR